MNQALKLLAISALIALPLTVFAADTTTSQTTPPPGTPVYPCWDMMQNGQMTPMRGMWHMGGPGMMQGGMGQGGMMMMNLQEVQQMQKEIEELRKQVMELKNKPSKE